MGVSVGDVSRTIGGKEAGVNRGQESVRAYCAVSCRAVHEGSRELAVAGERSRAGALRKRDASGDAKDTVSLNQLYVGVINNEPDERESRVGRECGTYIDHNLAELIWSRNRSWLSQDCGLGYCSIIVRVHDRATYRDRAGTADVENSTNAERRFVSRVYAVGHEGVASGE